MEIEPYVDSTYLVIDSPYFWLYIGLIISFGMVFGGRLNEGMNGFRKSMMILLPFSLMLFVIMASRLFYTATIFPLGANAYNNVITLIITTFFYTLGLFMGHMVVSRTIKKIYMDKGINPEKTNNLMNI